MPTLVQILGQILAENGVAVEYGQNELLATIPLRNGRSQVVKGRWAPGRYGTYTVLRLQSRVGVARGAAMIRAALTANAKSDCGAYALDLSVDPPLLDVVYGYVITPRDEFEPQHFFAALQHLAALADTAEQRISDRDVY